MYFEKTENKRMKNGYELVQIRYTKDLPQFNVNAGDLGGWVSERAFLEQNGKWFLGVNDRQGYASLCAHSECLRSPGFKRRILGYLVWLS